MGKNKADYEDDDGGGAAGASQSSKLNANKKPSKPGQPGTVGQPVIKDSSSKQFQQQQQPQSQSKFQQQFQQQQQQYQQQPQQPPIIICVPPCCVPQQPQCGNSCGPQNPQSSAFFGQRQGPGNQFLNDFNGNQSSQFPLENGATATKTSFPISCCNVSSSLKSCYPPQSQAKLGQFAGGSLCPCPCPCPPICSQWICCPDPCGPKAGCPEQPGPKQCGPTQSCQTCCIKPCTRETQTPRTVNFNSFPNSCRPRGCFQRQCCTVVSPPKGPTCFPNNFPRCPCSCGPICNCTSIGKTCYVCSACPNDNDVLGSCPRIEPPLQPIFVIKKPRRRCSRASCKSYPPPPCDPGHTGLKAPAICEYCNKPRLSDCCPCPCSTPRQPRRRACPKFRRSGLKVRGTGTKPFHAPEPCNMQNTTWTNFPETTSGKMYMNSSRALNLGNMPFYQSSQSQLRPQPYPSMMSKNVSMPRQIPTSPQMRLMQDKGSSVLELGQMARQMSQQGVSDEGCFVNMVSPVVSGADVSCKGIQSSCDCESTNSESSPSPVPLFNCGPSYSSNYPRSPGRTGVSTPTSLNTIKGRSFFSAKYGNPGNPSSTPSGFR